MSFNLHDTIYNRSISEDDTISGKPSFFSHYYFLFVISAGSIFSSKGLTTVLSKHFGATDFT